MDKIKAVIRNAMLASTALKALVNTRIAPAFGDVRTAKIYPLITMAYTQGATELNQLSIAATITIDIWGKGGNDELWAIYNEVREVLNLKQFYTEGDVGRTVCSCREVYVNDDLYEKDTMLYHLTARYRLRILRG